MLPKFELKTIRAVQSIAGNRPPEHRNWYSALKFMEKQIDKAGEFDVAIIGCGAYGMPLGAYIKRLGKIAVHMGGYSSYLASKTSGLMRIKTLQFVIYIMNIGSDLSKRIRQRA